MNYFYIYSAGGGAGDWNGIKRIWKTTMPPAFKQNVLLKFGDIYFNHASGRNLIKPTLWQNVTNARTWLAQAVNDEEVQTKTEILLDNGTSKIVNWVATQIGSEPDQIITGFDNQVSQHQILNKYAQIVKSSKINEAVTFDIPNGFKIRTQTGVTKTLHFDSSHQTQILKLSAGYANKLYELLDNDQSSIMTAINGSWSAAEIKNYLELLNYKPAKIAVGGISGSANLMKDFINKINLQIPLTELDRIHFLGAGGIKTARAIKQVYNGANASVDNSTPMNRAIDGNTAGTSQSGYFDYETCGLTRINPSTVPAILSLHQHADQPLFSITQMSDILSKVLAHQSHDSSEETYDARAALSIHNHDVFRRNAR